MVLGLCRMFRCLPSQLYAEDAELIRLLQIEAFGGGPETGEGGDFE
jgi:hypothetical protein